MSAYTDYWAEALSCAFEETGAYEVWLKLTDTQRKDIAKSLECASLLLHLYSCRASQSAGQLARACSCQEASVRSQMTVLRSAFSSPSVYYINEGYKLSIPAKLVVRGALEEMASEIAQLISLLKESDNASVV